MALKDVGLTLNLTFTSLLCLLVWPVTAAEYTVDLCNEEHYHPTPHLNPGDKGFISAVYDTGDSPSCDVTLHSCDVCKFVIYVKALQIPACETFLGGNSSSTLCLEGCSHLLIYDVAYQEVTSQWYFRGNDSATYTSLSSQVAFRLCLPQGHKPRDVKVRLKFEVKRKETTFTGSSFDVNNWSTFQSANFPDGYALRGEKFIYYFHNLDPGGVVHVTFDDWDLTPMSRILEYNGKDRKGDPSGEYYGSTYRPVIRSRGPDLTLVFQTDVYIEHRLHYMGFRATYTFLAGNASQQVPSTDCGGHTRHSVGGVIAVPPVRLQDCVWVVSAETPFQWLELRLNATVVNSTQGDWTLAVREGLISTGPIVSTISPSQMQSAKFQSLFSHRKGFYVHFVGRLHKQDLMSFTYLSYNIALNDSCTVSTDARCDRDHCIDRHLVCDGDIHCKDGADEPSNCFYGFKHSVPANISSHSITNPCNEKQILCKDGLHCVPMRMLCDNLRDCPDGSDESDCTNNHDTVVPNIPNPKSVICGGDFVACNSGDQCVAKWELCDQNYQCWDKSDELQCEQEMSPKKHTTEISLSVVLPICLVVFLVVCLALAIRMRRYSKGCRHRCAGRHRPHRVPLFSRHIGIPHGCRSCSVSSGGRLLQLSRSTSGASTLIDPLASPPPYEDALLSPSPRSVSEASATTEFSTLPVIVEPVTSETGDQPILPRPPNRKQRTNFDFESGIS